MTIKFVLAAAFCIFSIQGCGSSSSGDVNAAVTPVEPSVGASLQVGAGSAQRLSISDLSFVGAFALPTAKDNVSTLDYSSGVIEVNGDSLFIVGHDHDDAVAEFAVPGLVDSTDISKLQMARRPRQGFVKVLDRSPAGNPESLDEIVGLEVVGESLVINATEYYDAPADNQLTTLVIENAADLDGSAVGSFRSMEGLARAAGWISSIPQPWRAPLGGTHITGYSSGGPIIGRHSVGPSAFAIDLETAVKDDGAIATTELLGFSLDKPLNGDLLNETSENKLWTQLSQARFGFVVPGTSTYLTLGSSGGHQSGIGYKISQNNGNVCGGYCSYGADDNYNYYWLWDLDDLVAVKNGSLSPERIKPYESGELNLPFQRGDELIRVGGASFDPVRELLYISLLKANNTLGQYNNPPIIVAYRINR